MLYFLPNVLLGRLKQIGHRTLRQLNCLVLEPRLDPRNAIVGLVDDQLAVSHIDIVVASSSNEKARTRVTLVRAAITITIQMPLSFIDRNVLQIAGTDVFGAWAD